MFIFKIQVYFYLQFNRKDRCDLTLSNQLLHLPPPHVLMLQALHHRLPSHHPQYPYVKKKLQNELSGNFGESKLLYPLSKFPVRNKSLPNVRLSLDKNYFQLDYLIITRRFLLILESKYYSDDLIFDETVYQVIQKKEQGFRVFDDPVLQVEEQSFQLATWLENHGFLNLPIESFVVMTNARTRLQINPTNLHHAEKVISLQRLPSLFRELIAKYNDDLLTNSDISFLENKIKISHQNYLPNILDRYQVSKDEIKKGVFCMNCGNLGMKMIHLRWQCPACNYRDPYAHENALKDYFLLVDKSISNKEFRQFTHLKARSTSRDILRRSAKGLIGNTSTSRHRLQYDYAKEFNYLLTLANIKESNRLNAN